MHKKHKRSTVSVRQHAISHCQSSQLHNLCQFQPTPDSSRCIVNLAELICQSQIVVDEEKAQRNC